jgi:hypothetical protein
MRLGGAAAAQVDLFFAQHRRPPAGTLHFSKAKGARLDSFKPRW